MQISAEERNSGRLTPTTLEFAIQQVKVNGFVVFESALPPAFLQTLHNEYLALFEKFMANPPEKTFGKNHYRVDLPFREPFSNELVVANGLAAPVIEALLGPDCTCRYFASNTCMPGSEFQQAHSDIYPLFPESAAAPPAYHVVLNIPLVDTTLENGPMEFWPGGTHLHTLPREEIERLAPQMHSEMAVMPAGSIMIRDGRMWHRGTRNRSDAARPNIALVYQRAWLAGPTHRTIQIPQATYDGISERAQGYFRMEKIGQPVDCEL